MTIILYDKFNEDKGALAKYDHVIDWSDNLIAFDDGGVLIVDRMSEFYRIEVYEDQEG